MKVLTQAAPVVVLIFAVLFQANLFADKESTVITLKILAIGDSTTAGTPGFRSGAEAPPDGEGDKRSQYAYWMMKEQPQWKVTNRGINGERSDEILARLEKDIATFKPEMVIILAGVNDLYQGRSAENVKAYLTRMYQIITQRKLKVVACTILPYNSADGIVQKSIRDVNDWIRRTSESHEYIFCDTFQAVEDPSHPFHLKETPDGLHPSVNVYQQMGEAIAGAIESRI